MAPIPSRRRRQQPQREEIPESIFDALNRVDPNGNPVTKEKVANTGPTIEDLQRQLSAMNERVEAAERIQTVITAPAHIPEVPKEPTFNLDNLPDPVSDPKAYTKQMAARQAAYSRQLNDYYQEQNNVKAKTQGTYQQLWTDFASQYGEYADDQEGVEFATNKVRNTLIKRGVDVDKYMFSNPEKFFKEITKTYDARFGQPGEDDEPVREEPVQRRRQPAQRQAVDRDGDELPIRTGGIFGGIDGGSGGRAPAQPQAGDMLKDLRDIQIKTGYYG